METKEQKKELDKKQSIFNKLKNINVSDKLSVRGDKTKLTYLSWADALHYLYSEYGDSDVSYIIHENENLDNLPIFGNVKIGYYVKTTMTICNISRSMILPVLDYRNSTMLDNIDMFAINKAVMRCLVKNIAVFGLGLYVYQGEDLPDEEAKEIITIKNEVKDKINKVKEIAQRNKAQIDKINPAIYTSMMGLSENTKDISELIERAFGLFATNELK